MNHDTDIGGSERRTSQQLGMPFSWHRAVLIRKRTSRPLEALIRVYWKPIYTYIRLKWGKDNEDAKDLTQAFFTRALEKEFFQRYDPAKARFRTYLRICVDGFLSNERKSASCGNVAEIGSSSHSTSRALRASSAANASLRKWMPMNCFIASGCAAYSVWRWRNCTGTVRLRTEVFTLPFFSATIWKVRTLRTSPRMRDWQRNSA